MSFQFRHIAAVAAALRRARRSGGGGATKVFNSGSVGRVTAPEGIAPHRDGRGDQAEDQWPGRDQSCILAARLGGDREVIEGVQLGTVDMTISSTSIFAEFRARRAGVRYSVPVPRLRPRPGRSRRSRWARRSSRNSMHAGSRASASAASASAS